MQLKVVVRLFPSAEWLHAASGSPAGVHGAPTLLQSQAGRGRWSSRRMPAGPETDQSDFVDVAHAGVAGDPVIEHRDGWATQSPLDAVSASEQFGEPGPRVKLLGSTSTH